MAQATCDQCDHPALYWTTRGAWCAAHAGSLVIEEDRDEIIRQRDAARAQVEALSKVMAEACGDIDRLKDERDADLTEIQTLTRELEEMRETLRTQADVAQQRIMTLEVENLRLKRLLSPVEEG